MPIIKDVRAAKGESQVKAGSGIFGSHSAKVWLNLYLNFCS